MSPHTEWHDTNLQTFKHSYKYIHTYIRTRNCTSHKTGIHVCAHQTYAYASASAYVCICIHTHKFTYTHTREQEVAVVQHNVGVQVRDV